MGRVSCEEERIAEFMKPITSTELFDTTFPTHNFKSPADNILTACNK